MVERLTLHIVNFISWIFQLILFSSSVALLIYSVTNDVCVCSDVSLLCDLDRPDIYYNCSAAGNRPTLEICPSGQRFDVFRGVCLPSDVVECLKGKELRKNFYFPNKCRFNFSSSLSTSFTGHLQNECSTTATDGHNLSTAADERPSKPLSKKILKKVSSADGDVSVNLVNSSYNLSVQNDDLSSQIISAELKLKETATVSQLLPVNNRANTTKELAIFTSRATPTLKSFTRENLPTEKSPTHVTLVESVQHQLNSKVVSNLSPTEENGEKRNRTLFGPLNNRTVTASTGTPLWKEFTLQSRQQRDNLVQLCKQGSTFLCDSSNRSVFYRCFNNRPYRYICPKPLLFDSNIKECSRNQNAVCFPSMDWRHLAFGKISH
uniref:Chitin-binding type-2 domain-containing protein n=1 Tax=Octopus bimaculoides TaxID=37653 RepID=A0A0L8GKU8_OCTBM